MRIVRFRDGSSDYWGIAREGFVHHMPDAPFWFGDDGEIVGAIDSVELLCPVKPGKIICVGLNYAKHVTERDPDRKIPTEPVLFMKPPSALINHLEPIRIHHPDHQTHHEAELVVVMGKRAEYINQEDSLEYVLGYTCGNDVSDRDLQAQDGQFVRAKGFNTYAPIGPWIETQIDPTNLKISCTVNEEVRQNSTTANMIFPVDFLVSFISNVMTLEPGDIIMTGTPEGVGPLVSHDTCTVAIERIGSLQNQVRYLRDEEAMVLGPKVGGGGDD